MNFGPLVLLWTLVVGFVAGCVPTQKTSGSKDMGLQRFTYKACNFEADRSRVFFCPCFEKCHSWENGQTTNPTLEVLKIGSPKGKKSL